MQKFTTSKPATGWPRKRAASSAPLGTKASGIALAALAVAGCRGSFLTLPTESAERSTFQAREGRYFPPFVERAFPGSRTFATVARNLGEARSGVQLIEVRRLSRGSPSQNEANLSWSGDGVFLGYEVVAQGRKTILVKNLAGDYSRTLRMVPAGPETFLDGMIPREAQSYSATLRWSPDSAQYAFMSNARYGAYNIYAGGVGQPERVVVESSAKDGFPAWNPQGREIAFVSGRSGNGDIYTIEPASRSLQKLSAAQDIDIFPEWFPDGQKIVFASGQARRHNLKVVTRRNGRWQAPRLLTDWAQDDLRPTVSPDGRLIAFYATGERETYWNLHVVPYRVAPPYRRDDLIAAVVARNVIVDINTGPAWSPDGTKVFYIARDTRRFNPIMAYDLDAGRRYELATGTRMNRDLMVSRLGILSFRAQVGAWDRVYLALTNQGMQLQDIRLVRADRSVRYPPFRHKEAASWR